MARIKNPKSKISFGGLGLTKQEDEVLKKLLDKTDNSIARLKRQLIREWIKKQAVQT